MKIRLFFSLLLAVVLAGALRAQNPPSPAGQNPASGGDRGQGVGRGGFGGRGLIGTVTEVAADHYAIKTYAGDVYTVHLGDNTRIFKMPAGMRGGGGGQGMGRGGNPPEQLKASDIKVGDIVEARGETDATAKTVSAAAVALVDPERAKQMREMEANFGKTWLMGKVTSIDGVKVTLTGSMDNAAHSFVADENTAFRRRRDPITLADIQVGDIVRVDGAIKEGVFSATSVGVMGGMGQRGEGPGGPRNGAPIANPPQ